MAVKMRMTNTLIYWQTLKQLKNKKMNHSFNADNPIAVLKGIHNVMEQINTYLI